MINDCTKTNTAFEYWITQAKVFHKKTNHNFNKITVLQKTHNI